VRVSVGCGVLKGVGLVGARLVEGLAGVCIGLATFVAPRPLRLSASQSVGINALRYRRGVGTVRKYYAAWSRGPVRSIYAKD
jgi:hypothetical protein